ncbi:MAG TPA: ABC transporter substrate-binding protein [Longimicrobiales bacterium]
MVGGTGGRQAPASRAWTRREVLGAVVAAGSLAALGRPAELLAAGEQDLRVGLVVPGGAASEAMERGATLGAEEAARTAGLLGRTFELVAVRAADREGVEDAVRRLVAERGVYAIIGGADEGSFAALSDAAERDGVLFLNAGCADPVARDEHCRRHTLHIAASTAMYVDAVAQWLAGEAGLRRWCFVSPDTPSGNAVYRRARRALEAQGGEAVGRIEVGAGTDDFGSLLRDIERKGADLAFVDLAGEERRRFLEHYSAAAPGFEVTGPAGVPGEPGDGASRPRVGTWPTLWHHTLSRYGATQLNERFRTRFGLPMDALGWAGWFAVKVAWEAVNRASTTSGSELVRFLESERAAFDGHKGRPLSFRPWDHQLRQPVYLVKPAAGPGGGEWEVVAELPRAVRGQEATSQELLDRLGDGEAESRCRLAPLS